MGKRRPNLTVQDIRCLSDYVKRNRQTLFGKAGSCAEKIRKRKEEAWARGLTVLEAQGLKPGRTPKDLRLTWNELSMKARKYRDSRNKTGGGPPLERIEKFEIILDSLVEESIEGVVGAEEEAGLPLPCSQTSQLSENEAAVSLIRSMGVVELVEGEQPAQPTAASGPSSAVSGPSTAPKQLKKRNRKSQKSYEEQLLGIEREKLRVLKKMLKVMEKFVDIKKNEN